MGATLDPARPLFCFLLRSVAFGPKTPSLQGLLVGIPSSQCWSLMLEGSRREEEGEGETEGTKVRAVFGDNFCL